MNDVTFVAVRDALFPALPPDGPPSLDAVLAEVRRLQAVERETAATRAAAIAAGIERFKASVVALMTAADTQMDSLEAAVEPALDAGATE